MKPDRLSGRFRPFADLKTRLQEKSIHLPQAMEAPQPLSLPPEAESMSDAQLFGIAMSGVIPLKNRNLAHSPRPPAGMRIPVDDSDREVMRRLRDLVLTGNGFVVADTPEYMDGAGEEISPQIVRRLHRGDFSIQNHLDLHGFGVTTAKLAFDDFLSQAIQAGMRGVLIVHGRGLSSPRQPVLKTKVRQWLTRGPWRKWLMAYASARLCDGGTGATYVLLRSRPLKRRRHKRPAPSGDA